MKQILIIAQREFITFINSATGYLLISSFLILSMFLLWSSSLFSGEANMREFFQLWPWFSMIVIPAITMKSMTEEKRTQTLEILLSHPIKEWQLVIGKLIGCWLFASTVILSTLPTSITFSLFSRFDWGLLLSQYLGAIMLAGLFSALGVLVASYTESLISSFLATASLIFIWILIGIDYLIMIFPTPIISVLRELSVTLRTEAFNRGVVTLKDISFFISIISIFIVLTTTKLLSNKTSENTQLKSKLLLSTLILIIIGFVSYQTLSTLNFRFDLTKNQASSLSIASKQTLNQLEDLVNITFYTSTNVPGEYTFTKRYTEDLLKDYASESRNKVKTTIKNPDKDQTIAQEAIEAGISVVEFRTADNNKFQAEKGYLGLNIEYSGKSEAINFILDPQNLESEITKRIRKLTRKEPQEIGIATNTLLNNYQDYSLLTEYISTQYTLVDVDLSSTETDLTDINTLMIVSPSEQLDSTASGVLNNYLDNGGNMMLFLDRVEPNTQFGMANFRSNDWSELLSKYGVSVNQDIVYDLLYNESISIPSGPISYALSYPYWIRGIVNENFAPVSSIQSVTLAWPSSISITPTEGINHTVLVTTSPQSGISTTNLSIAPDQIPTTSLNQSYNLGVSIENNNSKIIIISDADIIIDQFTQYKNANASFVSNLLDWVASDETELLVPRKDFSPAILQFTDPQFQIPLAQWGNIIGVPVIISILGFLHLRRRQKLSNRQWHKI